MRASSVRIKKDINIRITRLYVMMHKTDYIVSQIRYRKICLIEDEYEFLIKIIHWIPSFVSYT